MNTILKKSSSFFDVYERRPGSDKLTTTYCPGCGHGVLHKLIAEALDDFGVREKTIFISPVGCSVFAYYYFHTGNVQVAHGRAPAAATGIKRAHPGSIVISYQGDGDLAAIGTAEIIHAANRGEGITVFFVNNAVYGMTGGQMAPTTLIGQKTMTTPRGRSVENDGYPIRMSEIIATLDAPVFVERVMIGDTKSTMHTRQTVRKALKLQIEKNGFSFIEVLAACPSQLKMTPSRSKLWVKEVLEKRFPLGVCKDISGEFEGRKFTRKDVKNDELHDILDLETAQVDLEKISRFQDKPINEEIKVAGFGGQGVLSLGTVLSEMGMRHNYEVSWLPSYGPEMRGGTANCSVKISKKKIGSPLVANPTILIAMNRPSLDKFENDVVSGGLIIYDDSLIDRKPVRDDVDIIPIPATKLADELGNTKAANMVIVGALITVKEIMSQQIILDSLGDVLKRKNLVELNQKAILRGAEYIKNLKK
ncbi:2-oxoacid:acceptor oxidoreductase family protein [bacterium]|nr:2-oxoacid:acceptor oxidoreductase family protein [bacterium]MBU1063217.1 2-oxoacid:acceptor oxidoreductase family protein [bacterium]MBU1633698.1 2-oxoacid:acceptor oxidoreductase family protein [bacterium]MBU1875120.1 2-oxoacid:acceptor oxidoreductase family protein [bacterium]